MGPIFFANRPKNSIDHLADIGITASSREDIISGLEVENYSKGPEPETQYGGVAYWVFGTVIKKHEIYIKLTVNAKTFSPICISFHKAEIPMNLPYRKKNLKP